MGRELLLFRHGKSDWDVNVDDFNRPLKKRGKRAAQRVGAWLRQQGFVPDYLISSPAERAKNTAVKLAKAMGLTVGHVDFDSRIYEADLNDLLAVLANCPASSNRVMIVGHNPGLEVLLEFLAAEQPTGIEDGKILPTATMAVFSMPEKWGELEQGCATLQSITRPDQLPDSFPFYGLTGLEFRDRPSYYYSQSAAIPYRLVDGQLQILLISSSGDNHWTIPKGIIEPGLTASASAAKEAWEEAGVEGEISEQMLGYYPQEKWGGTCTVQVYPLAVAQLHTVKKWQEHHRQRHWFTVSEAGLLVKQKLLQIMFEQLASLLAEKE